MKTSFLKQTLRVLTITALLAAAASAACAEVKLNSLFSDGAVLQQGVAVPVWGTARDGERVTVKFQRQTLSTTAKDGRWLVKLKPLKAGGPYTLSVAGEDNTVIVSNVLVGEVWVGSGQSNMAFQLSRAANAEAAIAGATDPQLRLFTVPRNATDNPLSDAPGAWVESSPETAAQFSAVAWFFGRDLRRALKVPVGLINSSVGGTPAEAWTSRAALEADPDLKQILERYAESVRTHDPAAAAARHNRARAQHKAAVARAKAAGERAPQAPRAPRDPRQYQGRPCALYNGMIAPLQPYAIAGVIWYQGEANAGRAEEYRGLFPAMIQDWRRTWGQGAFPFLFVQIAPHERMTPEIREAQLLSWQKVRRSGMAVITDIGNETDIHPTKKEPVGARLALAARAIAYGEKITYSGPVYKAMKVEDTRAVLSFGHVGGGLVAEGGELKGFTIAGADGNFVPAAAVIEADKVVVSSPSVAKPAAVRYGWANTPDVNLFNREGLPATPFRTDVKSAGANNGH
ncbi:MAG TPA: sialate O-acetylesterase [Candidatus Paceibacterota bacterium]|nr:sialate O-acetylesterase [Verrucomicrobiota bacterium]HSA10754.1 sialate O-acetylesterase [Candidatus Paceibacterota bacterium]